MFSLPIPQILVSLHNDATNNNNNNNTSTSPTTTTTTSTSTFGARIASTLQKMGANISTAADELSEELSALLEASASLSSPSSAPLITREELYSFFDDGFDDDAEEMVGGASGARTPTTALTKLRDEEKMENPRGYFALATACQEETPSQCRRRSGWKSTHHLRRQGDDEYEYGYDNDDDGKVAAAAAVPDLMADEGYYSSDVEMDDSSSSGDDGDEEEREALLPAQRFSWRGTSPERCSLLYYGK